MRSLLGALRTGDSAQLVFRYEPAAGSTRRWSELESSTDTDVVRGRLGSMQDLLAAVQRMARGQRRGAPGTSRRCTWLR